MQLYDFQEKFQHYYFLNMFDGNPQHNGKIYTSIFVDRYTWSLFPGLWVHKQKYECIIPNYQYL